MKAGIQIRRQDAKTPNGRGRDAYIVTASPTSKVLLILPGPTSPISYFVHSSHPHLQKLNDATIMTIQQLHHTSVFNNHIHVYASNCSCFLSFFCLVGSEAAQEGERRQNSLTSLLQYQQSLHFSLRRIYVFIYRDLGVRPAFKISFQCLDLE